MIDSIVSIFITIDLDCCNSYCQKAFERKKLNLFGMIDSNVSIFITIDLDCCNSYCQKAFHNSCRCKYFKRDFFFNVCTKKFKIVFQIELEQFEGQ